METCPKKLYFQQQVRGAGGQGLVRKKRLDRGDKWEGSQDQKNGRTSAKSASWRLEPKLHGPESLDEGLGVHVGP